MATLEQILNFRNLTGVIMAVKSGIPNPLPPEFMTPGKKVSGNKGEYFKITGTRQTARVVQYGSPADRRNLRDVGLVPITLMHTYESQQWPLAMTIALTKMTSLEHDRMGEQQAEYQTREFKKLFVNLRIASSLYALFQGKIFLDNNGNLSASSTTSGVSSATTIDFGIPATNTGNANGIISTLWNNATAKIMTQLLQIQTASTKLTGYPLEHAFYADEIPGYIGSNAEAQQYLKLQPAMGQQYVTTGTVPNGFGGIKYWHRAGQSFFNDKNGDNQSIMPSNRLVLTPGYDPDWFEVMEGSYPVPNSIMPVIGGDASSALRNVTEMFGMFQYAQLTLNPVTVEQFAGDTFIPVVKVPGSMYLLDVA